MYVKLKNNIVLRGWKGIPRALTDTTTGQTTLLNDLSFQAATFCDGLTPMSAPFVLAAHRAVIDKFIEAGVAAECREGEGLAEHQKYRRSDSRYVQSVHWSITGRCNLRCRHCFMSAPKGKYGQLTTDQCLDIVRQISDANIASVSLTGGEPLIREDFWQIVDAIQENHIRLSHIYTNGVLMSDVFLDHLAARNITCVIALSFDCSGHHDWMRGVAGAEKLAIEAVERAVGHGFSVFVETAIHKDNLGQLVPTYELLKSLGVSSWKVSPAMTVGNWKQEHAQHAVSLDHLYNAFLELAGIHQRDEAPIEMMLGGVYLCRKNSHHYFIPMESRFDGTERACRQTVCGSCRTHLYIMADGRLLPCMPMTESFLQKDMPNLLDTTITLAMVDSKFFDTINIRLEKLLAENPECSACKHCYRCGGGCRANALNHSDSFYGKDPDACHFFRMDYPERIRRTLEDASQG